MGTPSMTGRSTQSFGRWTSVSDSRTDGEEAHRARTAPCKRPFSLNRRTYTIKAFPTEREAFGGGTHVVFAVGRVSNLSFASLFAVEQILATYCKRSFGSIARCALSACKAARSLSSLASRTGIVLISSFVLIRALANVFMCIVSARTVARDQCTLPQHLIRHTVRPV